MTPTEAGMICAAAVHEINALNDHLLELLSYCDRRQLSDRERQVLLMATRESLKGARALLASIGFDLLNLMEAETGSQTGSTSGPTSFLEAENP